MKVKIYKKREEMGYFAAREAAACMLELLDTQEEIRVLFAAAPSQLEFLHALRADERIPWNRVRAFHLDEYLGLEVSAPQGFGNFLANHLFHHVPLRAVHYLAGEGTPEALCRQYSQLLAQYPPDIACIGIGENGHLAFNDPPVADFDDPLTVKVVALDPVCRMQQVNDGCFHTLEAVPAQAMTLTIPAMMAAPHIFCMVPGPSKARAVADTLEGELTTACPASILRQHPGAALFLDEDSAAGLRKKEAWV